MVYKVLEVAIVKLCIYFYRKTRKIEVQWERMILQRYQFTEPFSIISRKMGKWLLLETVQVTVFLCVSEKEEVYDFRAIFCGSSVKTFWPSTPIRRLNPFKAA